MVRALPCCLQKSHTLPPVSLTKDTTVPHGVLGFVLILLFIVTMKY